MAPTPTLKDHFRENRLFLDRIIAAAVIMLLLLLAVVGELVYLQVLNHSHYTTLSNGNRIRLAPIAPTRGLIYDRNGVLLAENLPAYRLEITPEQVKDMDGTLKRLGQLVSISDADLQRFRQLLKHKRRFESVPLRFRLSDEELARVAVELHTLPGVDVVAHLNRHYPLGALAAHVVGYVGRINERELNIIDEANYSGTTHIGKTGVEKSYEDVLHGKVGLRQLEVNAQGRTVRVLDTQPAVPGDDLYLSLDADLQQTADKAFGDRRGALVALDPRNGEVLALVSRPSFDPNLFVNGIPAKDYDILQHDPDRPLFNRALRGQYPPGSTIKPLMGLAGLVDGVTTVGRKVFCPGYYQLPGSEHHYRDWKHGGHGLVDLTNAIEQSCDVYFYELANSLGIDRMHAFLSKFGFGAPTGVDLPGELGGLLPSKEWKRRARNEPWYPGETLIAGIGQGFFTATPLQLASAMATLAMHGKRFAPRTVAAEKLPDGSTQPMNLMPLPSVSGVSQQDWNAVIHGMEEVIYGPHGTARRLGVDAPYRFAGKTGTAQVFGIPQEERYDPKKIAERLRDHALFVAIAPLDKPRIVIAVIVENGGSGGAVAGPIARAVMDRYLQRGKVP